MSKQTERTSLLEQKVDSMHETLMEVKNDLKEYFKGRSDCLVDINGLKGQTKLQWGLMAAIFLMLLGAVFAAIKLEQRPVKKSVSSHVRYTQEFRVFTGQSRTGTLANNVSTQRGKL